MAMSLSLEKSLKVKLRGSAKEWILPSKFLTKVEDKNLGWEYWIQISGLLALLFPSSSAYALICMFFCDTKDCKMI